MSLNDIIQNGNRGANLRTNNEIRCADGFRLSVVAGGLTYCAPRGTYGKPPTGPFSEVEVGFPSEQPEPWDRWREYAEDPNDPTDTVYGYVPVELVRELVAAHGGEPAR